MRNSRSRTMAAAFTLLALALVGLAAWALADNQANQRQDVRNRFVDRTQVASSLIDALFRVAFTSQQGDLARRLSGRVTNSDMDALARRGQAAYTVLVDPAGHVLASSRGTPPGTAARLAARPSHLRVALRNGFGLADTAGRRTVESAIAFPTPRGTRVVVQGSPLQAYSTFLAGTLKPLPSAKGSEALVLDGRGMAVGGRTHNGGAPVVSPALLRVTRAGRSQGAFRANGKTTFAGSAPLPATHWQVVVTVPESELYASVNGTARWIPWLILAAAALALGGVALLIWRLAGTTSMLESANAELDASRRGLEERARELERSNADLEQFAYAASHDLSEPLRTVAGFSQLLQTRYGGRLDAQADEYIGHMASGVDRMQQLIDDLLRYSRVGRAPLREDDVDLEAVLGDVLEWLRPAIDERGARVTHDPLPLVRGERSQLAQVLQNLVANGVKFTAPDTVPEVHVSAAPEGREGWRISVRDNGIGVGKHDDDIYKMFGRLHPADRYPGTGIGLALAKRIVEGHGGRIWVEPAEGGGSVFAFTVPAGARVRQEARA